jgi:DNA-binding SARP family transcriptional activator
MQQPVAVRYDFRHMDRRPWSSQNWLDMEPHIGRHLACDPCSDEWAAPRTRHELRETDMRYATQADADPHASSTKKARESFGVGAGNCWAEDKVTRTGIKAPIQVFTLGRFSIAIDEQAVHSQGKAKHRPLGLLKALIALGGRDVASSRLCECLWPDSEGDLGARNLTITLHRLRSLLQSKAAVLSDNGKLSLNEGVCWVDAWSFERFVNEGLSRLDESVIGEPYESQLRLALNLYTGHFLAREFEESWMFAPRLRLKAKFERLVTALATHLERHNRFADAIDVCLQALERDPLNELLYRRLMGCHLKRGELAEAARTYGRCREALAKGLAMHPSMETERLYFEGVRGTAERGVARTSMLPYGVVQL